MWLTLECECGNKEKIKIECTDYTTMGKSYDSYKSSLNFSIDGVQGESCVCLCCEKCEKVLYI